MKIFSRKFLLFFSYFCSKHRLWVHVLEPHRRGEAVLTSTHNLCFGAKIRKIGIPLHNPVLLYIKVGFKGVYITRTCFPDEYESLLKYICTIFCNWNSVDIRDGFLDFFLHFNDFRVMSSNVNALDSEVHTIYKIYNINEQLHI